MTADPEPLSPEPAEDLLRRQDGVVSRPQLTERRWRQHDIDRMVRRRAWVRVHEGVYVDHTGVLTWQQRAWAAVLSVWPAALAGRSALRAVAGPSWRDHDDHAPIEVAVARERHVVAREGVRVRRIARFAERSHLHHSPPRMRFEEALLDRLAEVTGEWARIELVAAACRSRCTTAARLAGALDGRARLPDRAWLAALLDDVAAGTHSVLEHGYLTHVERAHGLPAPDRQPTSMVGGRTVRRDVDYPAYAVVVELDGALFHSSPAERDRDLDRDLAAAADQGRLTLRLGWGQVFDRPCRTSAAVATVLRQRGWDGTPSPCGSGCTAVEC